jgi:hypothetical protein
MVLIIKSCANYFAVVQLVDHSVIFAIPNHDTFCVATALAVTASGAICQIGRQWQLQNISRY